MTMKTKITLGILASGVMAWAVLLASPAAAFRIDHPCQDVGFHHILYKCEVPGLLAIAVYHRRLSLRYPGDKERNQLFQQRGLACSTVTGDAQYLHKAVISACFAEYAKALRPARMAGGRYPWIFVSNRLYFYIYNGKIHPC